VTPTKLPHKASVACCNAVVLQSVYGGFELLLRISEDDGLEEFHKQLSVLLLDAMFAVTQPSPQSLQQRSGPHCMSNQ